MKERYRDHVPLSMPSGGISQLLYEKLEKDALALSTVPPGPSGGMSIDA